MSVLVNYFLVRANKMQSAKRSNSTSTIKYNYNEIKRDIIQQYLPFYNHEIEHFDENTVVLHLYAYKCWSTDNSSTSLEFIEQLLYRGARIFTCLSTGESAVFYCNNIIKNLDINYGEDTFNDIKNLSTSNPQCKDLIFTITDDYEVIVEYLLYVFNYADQNDCFDKYTFVLCNMCGNEPYNFICYLIEQGANIFYVSVYGDTIIGNILMSNTNNTNNISKLDTILARYYNDTLLDEHTIDNMEEILSSSSASSETLLRIINNSK